MRLSKKTKQENDEFIQMIIFILLCLAICFADNLI